MESIRKKSKMIETYSVLLIDMLSLIVSYWAAVYFRFRVVNYEGFMEDFHWTVCVYLLFVCLVYALFTDGNRYFFVRGYFKEFAYTVRYTLILIVGLVVILYFRQQSYEFSRSIYLFFAIFNVVITYVAHICFKKFMLGYYRKSNGNSKMMVLTTDMLAKDVVERLIKEPSWNYEITSVAIYDADKRGTMINDVPVVASMENLYETVIQMMVDEVFMVLPGVPVMEVRTLIEKFEEMGLTCHYNVDLFSNTTSKTTAQKIAGYSVISYQIAEMDSRRMLVKRLIDIVGAVVGIVLTAIITPFVALAIFIEDPGPIFFSQIRIGKNGRRFRIWKFRSMYTDAEERKKELMSQNQVKGLMFKMDNDPRITKVGKFIRKTSIDETPQFFNILLGDMSLVGTRPPTVDEFEQYNGYYRRRLSITPGLTGMWQANGRSDIDDFDEIVKLDLEYIDNWSLGLDIKILFQTVFAVVGGKGSK